MNITVGDKNPDLGFWTQQTFCFSLGVLTRGGKEPVMITSVATDCGPLSYSSCLYNEVAYEKVKCGGGSTTSCTWSCYQMIDHGMF